MHNEIYDMDKKLCFSDCSNSMSVPSPCSSQSSMSSGTSGYSSANNLPLMNFPQYDINSSDINMTFVPASQNFDTSHFIQRTAMATVDPNASVLIDGKTVSYTSQLILHEEPTEKFRFRYKSEMHGTHGSLNGQRSEKNRKTFPEVELKNFTGQGVIRCSLYQTNLDKPSPHSHQLVVRKDDMDECDPHDVYVSPEKGYIARFENMGIIHTAKKNICDALYAKKKQKMKFEMGLTELSQRQEKTLRDEAEREGKHMNLNQVRLCFEAFKIVDGGWMKICEPIFSRPINNRKSALTGELKICRLSSVAGGAAGGEDIILLVEKVSKKNIQVRFFEMRDDDLVWEAFGDFSDADVHHQYAITVRTPPYKNKDIDKSVDVSIELVRKSDDERSTPVDYRYKPREIILSRKRRRTSYSTSTTSSAVSSSELPESVVTGMHPVAPHSPQTISQEFNKSEELNALLQTSSYETSFQRYMLKVTNDSAELAQNINPDLFNDLCKLIGPDGELQTDGETTNSRHRTKFSDPCTSSKKINPMSTPHQPQHPAMRHLRSAIKDKPSTPEQVATTIRRIFEDFSAENDSGDTIVHDMVKNGQRNDAIILFKILSKLNLTDLLSQTNNLGQTPLHTACLYDQPMFIRPLLGLNCDLNVQDSEGDTALHIAITENLKECLEGFASFISSSADGVKFNANLANDNGFTPLHSAIRQGNLNFIEVLLTKCNASAKVASSRDGNNALHLAVQHQSPEMIKCLLNHGKIQVNAKNRSGHTAIDLAKALDGNVKKEILDLLMTKLPASSNINSNNNVEQQTADAIKDEPEEENDSSTEEDDSLSSEIDERNEELHFKRLLQDEAKCRSLGEILDVDNKWKKLGSELKLDHLLFLWPNGETMLKFLVATDDMSAMKILNALHTVDPEVGNKAMAMLKT
ncbi:nuclear factor NF-kappa-B p110 subunit-like [Eupeodes corollae]|uniref:nuclear factor NF-kappa-B p110 subunit-like n=1 Tax=Eupeodes corollae TaxID=290404 RepID=UPI002492C893|nr:nuclear factor NF-kappa-B p110 subunit-like [Eupeodes corollae]